MLQNLVLYGNKLYIYQSVLWQRDEILIALFSPILLVWVTKNGCIIYSDLVKKSYQSMRQKFDKLSDD